jgi:hypothetical protein
MVGIPPFKARRYVRVSRGAPVLGYCRAEARPTFWGVVDHSTTQTRDATKNRGRGIGGGAQRKASIEGVRFRCRLQASLSTSHTPHAPKPIPRAAAIEACVPIPQSSLVTFFQRK